MSLPSPLSNHLQLLSYTICIINENSNSEVNGISVALPDSAWKNKKFTAVRVVMHCPTQVLIYCHSRATLHFLSISVNKVSQG